MKRIFLLIVILFNTQAFCAVEELPEVSDNYLMILNENFRSMDYRISNAVKDKGDSSSADFTQADLTTNNAWQDLDLSSIIPKDAKAVLFYVSLSDDAAGSELSFRKNGNFSAINISTIATQVANVSNYADILVFCDESAKVEYRGSNLSFTSISITVKGYLK